MTTLAHSIPQDVAEIQGLYGTFSFSEKLLQKIWLRRAFDLRHARTVDGRQVAVVSPGKWNLLGGPDFRGARIRFDQGPERTGDVELHLKANDWNTHGHAADPAYRNVVLHVVLFWPDEGCPTVNAGGIVIPTLPLLPLLHHDLEEYAADEAVEVLSNRPVERITTELAGIGAAELRQLLRRHARRRWEQKVHHAARRVDQLGWESACHHAALEVLGYRFNRAPMLRIAGRWPLSHWSECRVSADQALISERETWSAQGVRPANRPRVRLEQYCRWAAARRSWPTELLGTASTLLGQGMPRSAPIGGTRDFRHASALCGLRARLGDVVCDRQVTGTRFDTLVCDAFLPLLAARTDPNDLEQLWLHWFPGDVPPLVRASLRELAVCDLPEHPVCHGLAQGLIDWIIEREVPR